jgi:Zn-dependent protease with chaperone function
VSDVPALLHGPELPPSGVPARVHFHGDYLRVARHSGPAEDVAADTLQVDVTGFNEDVLQLSWERVGIAHAVTVSDAAAIRALLEQAPASVAHRLKGGHFRMRYHRHKWNVVVGVLASLVLLAGIAWWQSEAITMWLANRVSLETEVGIGNQALAQLEAENVLTREGLAAETLASIGTRLTKGSRYSYRWYVSDDREINAYALPGGIIVINAGMIEAAENAEELAAVLAHEIQHVEQRHTLQQMIHTAGWAAVLAVALGDVSAITAIVIHQLGNLRNSRKLEAQADVGGLEALARAGIPLTGMASLFRKLKSEQERRGGEGVALLSSHPATDERIADIERLAGTLSCDCRPLGIDWPAVQAATKEWRAAQ